MEFLGPTRRPIMCTCNFIWINKSKCRFYELCNSAGLRFIISSRTHKAIQRQQPTPWTRSIGHTCFINGRSLVSLPNVWAECILLKFLRIKKMQISRVHNEWNNMQGSYRQKKLDTEHPTPLDSSFCTPTNNFPDLSLSKLHKTSGPLTILFQNYIFKSSFHKNTDFMLILS